MQDLTNLKGFRDFLPEYGFGSCAGGGRYDNLIEQLVGESVPATGLVFGFARTVKAADKLGLIPDASTDSKVLVTILNQDSKDYALKIASKLREASITSEVFVNEGKSISNQLKYANDYGFKFAIIAGEDEIESESVTIKVLDTGKEKLIPLSQVDAYINGIVE